MGKTVGDFVVERLRAWGVRRVFGYPGDGINGVMGALRRAGDAMDLVQPRHEEAAAFMACAHAKFTGQVGVCVATSGPGAIHLLNGLYDARLDHQPVVAIVGQASRASMGGDAQQEVDLPSLFKDVAGAFVQTAMVPEQVRHLVDRAMRVASANRTVACVILPKDVQELDAVERPDGASAQHSGVGYSPPRVVPSAADLGRAARVLDEGERVAILVGAGALGATDEVVEVATVLHAGVAKALLGKAAVPDDLPFVTGSIGFLGTKPSWTLMQECDTLLMVGTRFPYTEFLPAEGKAKCVQIDLDPSALSLRYPADVALVGDSAQTLRALVPMLSGKGRDDWKRRIESEVVDWERLLDARAMAEADPLNPQRVFRELSSRLPARAIVTADAGTSAVWFARDLRLKRGMAASLSGGLASMGCGVPYAVAAKFAHPDRPVIAAVGDGAMQMLGNAELITVAKYWRRWRDPRLVVLVLDNQDLNMVSWEQRAFGGDPKYEASQSIPDFPYKEYAESLGLLGVRIDAPDEVGPAWDIVLHADRPAVLEAIVDPDVPPFPPHVTFEQASKTLAAILKGDPDAAGILRQSWRDVVAPLLHR
jgi:pyruvate dehydrogenase (quinone)